MELALHLGMTTEALKKSMLESELDQWAKYALRSPLPFKRIEIMLAQVCSMIARTMGGVKNVSAQDFMLQIPEDESLPANVVQLRAAFGFKPRKPKV